MESIKYQDIFDGTESHAESRIRNLTPHPVRLFVSPRGFMAGLEKEPQDGDGEWVKLDEGGELGQWVEIPPEDPARLSETDGECEWNMVALEEMSYAGTPIGVCAQVVERELGAPDLPEPQQGRYLLVSLPLLMGLQAIGVTRRDLLAPDTGSGAVRDDQGRIVGVKRLVRLAPPNNNALDAYRNFVRFIANGAGQSCIDHLTCQNAASLLEEHGDPIGREQAKEAS